MVTTELIRDPKERQARADEKEEWVLYFLRDEVYSSTAILANEMRVGVRAARTVLNRMEKKGLLVKDEVRFMGMKALPLWGITSAGIMHGLDSNEVNTVSLKYHRVGRISPLTIEHTLDVQQCQQYFLFNLDHDDWISTRFLPGHNEKRNSPERWPVYPDGIAKYSDEKNNCRLSAIEVERSRKTPARYVQLIRGHLRNIKVGRYCEVIYYCPTQKMADSLKALFLRLVGQKNITLSVNPEEQYNSAECLEFFKFKTMEIF